MDRHKMGEQSTPTTGYSLALQGLAASTISQFIQACLAAPSHEAGDPPATYGYLQTVAAPIWLSTAAGALQAIYVDHATGRGRIETMTPTDLLSRWPLATISRGRLFNQAVEWRWQPDTDGADHYALLGLSEEQSHLTQGKAQLAAAAPASEQRWCVSKSRLRLIGSIVPKPSNNDRSEGQLAQHGWREVRNPNLLLYPVSNHQDRNLQPRLVVQLYAQPTTGASVHTRYSHFETETVKVT